MSWSRGFDEPIQLEDAAEYILALPKSKQQSPNGRQRPKHGR
jgi:hypothetical protein